MNTKEQCRVKEVFLCRIFFESWLGSLPPEICISVQLYKHSAVGLWNLDGKSQTGH